MPATLATLPTSNVHVLGAVVGWGAGTVVGTLIASLLWDVFNP